MSNLYPSRMLLALQTTVYIAYHSVHNTPVKSVQIIERYGLNRRALEPILQILTREGILDSRQGANGGYTMARRNESLGTIARLFIEPVAEESIIFNDLAPVLISSLHGATEALLNALDGFTIDDCCAQAMQLGLPQGGEIPLDFSI